MSDMSIHGNAAMRLAGRSGSRELRDHGEGGVYVESGYRDGVHKGRPLRRNGQISRRDSQNLMFVKRLPGRAQSPGICQCGRTGRI